MRKYSRFRISLLFRENFFMLNLVFGKFVENWNAWYEGKSYDQVVVLSDETVSEHWFSHLVQSCSGWNEAELLVVPDGEESKSFDVLYQLIGALTEYQVSRNALLINLGGGVVSDLGGFLASIYKRGIDFVNIPTSLLAQVDASVGGKTGVNFESFKNHIGVFADPQAVFLDESFLTTLSEQEMKSGWGEVVKHGIIEGGALWDEVSLSPSFKTDAAFMQRVVKVKEGVVEQDPKEKGLRKVLNLGHTLGHAIEGLLLKSGKEVFHGECVLFGLYGEACLFEDNGVELNFLQSLERIVGQWTQPHKLKGLSADDLLELMQNDKKNQAREIRFAIAYAPGKFELDVRMDREELKTKLESWLEKMC